MTIMQRAFLGGQQIYTTSGVVEVSENGHLPTPLPACACRRSSSLILGLSSAPDCCSHTRNAWPAPSKSAIVKRANECRVCGSGGCKCDGSLAAGFKAGRAERAVHWSTVTILEYPHSMARQEHRTPTNTMLMALSEAVANVVIAGGEVAALSARRLCH